MKNSNSELVTYIKKFESYVDLTFKLFTENYNIEISPILAKQQKLIPRSGILEYEDGSVTFSFHGMGCYFKFGDIVVDFDYNIGSFDYKGFSKRKLFMFVDSYIKSNEDNKISQEKFMTALEKLEEEKIIEKVNPPYEPYKLNTKYNH